MTHTCRPERMEDSPVPRRILAGSMRTCVHWFTLIKFNIVNLKQVVSQFAYVLIGRLHMWALAKSLRVMSSTARCHVSMWFLIGGLAESARSRRGVVAESSRSRCAQAYFLLAGLGTTRSTQATTTTNAPLCATMLHVVVVVVFVAPHGTARVGIRNPLSGHKFSSRD